MHHIPSNRRPAEGSLPLAAAPRHPTPDPHCLTLASLVPPPAAAQADHPRQHCLPPHSHTRLVLSRHTPLLPRVTNRLSHHLLLLADLITTRAARWADIRCITSPTITTLAQGSLPLATAPRHPTPPSSPLLPLLHHLQLLPNQVILVITVAHSIHTRLVVRRHTPLLPHPTAAKSDTQTITPSAVAC